MRGCRSPGYRNWLPELVTGTGYWNSLLELAPDTYRFGGGSFSSIQ
jgi:hypothetical protein